MTAKSFLLRAAAYTFLTFGIAFSWHFVIFKDFYEQSGFFGREEPLVALGFLTILIEGIVVGFVYPYFARGENPLKEGLIFGALLGVFHGSGHILGAAEKYPIEPLAPWLAMEWAYIALQFALIGFVFGLIQMRQTRLTPAQ